MERRRSRASTPTAATEENIAAAEECGALLFIRKPYADSEITAAIGKMRRRLEDV